MTRFVTADQMRSLDRRAMDEYAIPGIVLMEHAGRAVADEVKVLMDTVGGSLQADVRSGRRIGIVCGSGNNGGDGLVAARHLYNAGYLPEVICVKDPDAFTADAGVNFSMVSRLPIPVRTTREPIDWDTFAVVVDALLGTGTQGEVHGVTRVLIDQMNDSGVPIVAVDVPSGLNADTGEAAGSVVRAVRTVTMALPKTGFQAEGAQEYTGNIMVADIGFPPELLK